jgi:hypothetical protein
MIPRKSWRVDIRPARRVVTTSKLAVMKVWLVVRSDVEGSPQAPKQPASAAKFTGRLSQLVSAKVIQPYPAREDRARPSLVSSALICG